MARSKKEIGTGFITQMDRYLFGEGTHYQIYDKLGAHPKNYKGKDGFYFAVWAPHAAAVSVVGDFNNWDPDADPMKVLETSGIYEAFIPGLKEGELYKFAITTQSGKVLFKSDPYAFGSEYRPGTASITRDISGFQWKDNTWMTKRETQDLTTSPLSIYEVHLGSWRKANREEKDGYYTYIEAAHELAAYVKDMGYTHVELMGIAEHPYDGSWGYQVTGYYAPTSRYGTAAEFMYFVNYMHKHGIGVILDWVPAHFPKDAHGLADFDGQALYEYADPRKGEHPDWGTKVFDYSRNEVSNFLIANALYWIEQYHIDGLRVDAVASMLYLDYGRTPGNWVPNQYGENKNLEAIEFFRHLNSVVNKQGHGAAVIAEESTAWPMVTGKAADGGLDFTYKWNMGWMHDFLDYMKLDPYFRKDNHNKMTFAMSYNYSEKYILVLSHDEVVHLKCSMLNKMPGLGIDKYRNLMAGYAFMMGHPGKKLLFMGQDFGQLREWSEKRELDWELLNDENHSHLQAFVKELLTIYKKYPAMYELDDQPDGFEWINPNDGYRSIFSFVRHGKSGRNNLLFVCNFTPMARPDYRVGVPKKKKYTLLLNSDDAKFGGEGTERPTVYQSEKSECDGRPYSFAYELPPYGVAIFKF